MLDTYQVIESRVLGADCILLIMAALEDYAAKNLEDCAIELGMDVLVEIHNEEELHRALKLKTKLLGVNNRNLKTMVTDISMTEKLASLAPTEKILISESGLQTPADLHRMASAGARCFLIGIDNETERCREGYKVTFREINSRKRVRNVRLKSF